MISFFITAFKVIFLLGFLVFIHEGGHFLVAKLCEVKVLEFAIGFGPKIFSRQGKQTKYSLRLIPLGGYVKLEGEEERSDDEGSFSNASIPKRMAIIAAGATVNIIFALLVYFILMLSLGNNASLVVDDVFDGYAAKEYGIISGDEIVKINNKKINIKSDIDNILSNYKENEELLITIKRDNQEKEILLVPSRQEYKSLGVYLKKDNKNGATSKIISVEKQSSGQKAGLRANDRIIKINDIEINEQNDINTVLQNLEEKENVIVFTVKRANEVLTINVEPDISYSYFLGIQFRLAQNTFANNMHNALFKTRDFILTTGDSLKQLFTGKVGMNQMMGPVGISEAVATTQNAGDFFYLMALISLSLGITNLLPFPALDGGKFALLILEAIRGKKLKEQTEINIGLIGFSILIILAIFVTYNDILRIF